MEVAAGNRTDKDVNFAGLLAEAILSTRSDAIVATDRDGVIRFWNPGAERMFGQSPDEAIGRSLDLIIPDRLRQRHWEGFAKVMQSGQSRYGEGDLLSVPALRNDGTTLSVQFTIAPLREAGQMVGMAAIIRDATKQFQETRELNGRYWTSRPLPADVLEGPAKRKRREERYGPGTAKGTRKVVPGAASWAPRAPLAKCLGCNERQAVRRSRL